jgi:hypothetical protein
MDEEILKTTVQIYGNKLHANDKTLLMITQGLKLGNGYQKLDQTFLITFLEIPFMNLI